MQLLDIPKQTPSSELDEEILNIFLEEVGEIIENIVTHFNAWKNDLVDSESITELLRSFHTLKGSGRLVGATVIGELGWQFENMLNKVIDGRLSKNDNMLSLIEQVEKVLPALLEQFQHNQAAPSEVILLISQAAYLTEHAGSLGEFELATTPHEPTLVAKKSEPTPLKYSPTTELPNLQESYTNDSLDDVELELESLDLPDGDLELESLDLPYGDLEMESLDLPEGDIDLGLLDFPEGDIDLGLLDLPEGDIKLESESSSLDEIKLETVDDKDILSVTDNIVDEEQQQTLLEDQVIKEIFFDEAGDILENTQSLLESWTAAPNNMPLVEELYRELHTLKGSALMVGIIPMGDLSHHLESVLKRLVEGSAQSNPKLQEMVQNGVDELAAMLEAVRSQIPLDIPKDLIEQINLAQEGKEAPMVIKQSTAISPNTQVEAQNDKPETSQLDKLHEKETEHADSPDERIRVRVTLIDKLTNLAGELSISRSNLEQQQGEFKNNLVEMEQTVVRLHDQLRRLHIETEAQIISNFNNSREQPGDNKEFDPLELDRFSVRQQLSGSLMESVSDLTNIQDCLKTLTRQSGLLLSQQNRIGAELQDGIMRARMIPFATISPRLQRIVRQTGRELRKQVDFIINGENIEFERTVLDRVVKPLDHMIRNAIGHGIENAQTRQQAGKPSVAKIIASVSREGAELIIKISDDGAGINFPAIRKKAEERGLIKPDTVVNDQDLMQLILKQGFSTAKELTKTQGRGVGMDVVNTEIKQLGGSLRINSKIGEGTTFEIRLPVSLTITQALMVHIGEEIMAVPMNYLDAIMRVPRSKVLGDPEEVRYYKYMNNNYRVFHLGKLLGFGKLASVESALIPILLIRAADHRVALVVDAIEGSKEIVVKPVGLQLSTIRWIAGATILGDGRVVFILDMPTLVREESTAQYIPPVLTEIVVEKKPAVNTIMVVDDSITVRKVTTALLKRQGMEVMTAKDGLDAVAKLRDKVPDLMLLDVEMPRMDGYELATQVRNNPDWKHLPIIMITSRTGPKHISKAEKIGINRYLGKPYKETNLLENIKALLAETEAKKT